MRRIRDLGPIFCFQEIMSGQQTAADPVFETFTNC